MKPTIERCFEVLDGRRKPIFAFTMLIYDNPVHDVRIDILPAERNGCFLLDHRTGSIGSAFYRPYKPLHAAEFETFTLYNDRAFIKVKIERSIDGTLSLSSMKRGSYRQLYGKHRKILLDRHGVEFSDFHQQPFRIKLRTQSPHAA